MKPSLEEVKEYFKDAEIVEDKDGDIANFNNLDERGIHEYEGDFYVYDNDKENVILWDNKKGYAKILTYKTPKFEITKEQILYIEKASLSYVSSEIKQWFPEVFKKELVVGSWYNSLKHPKQLIFVVDFKDVQRIKGYGFDTRGNWERDNNEFSWGLPSDGDYTESTPQEVEAALIREAKKRGYKENVLMKSMVFDNDVYLIKGEYKSVDDDFYFIGEELKWNGFTIFKDGIWATIIQDETFTKPLLSLNDLLSVWSEDNDTEFYKTSRLFKSFEKLAKSKIV